MKYHRRSIRLDGFDYSKNGYYFVTVCVQNRENLFGDIIENKGWAQDPPVHSARMILSEIGENIEKIILNYFDNENFKLDEFVLMPDHFHMIIAINNRFNLVGAGLVPAQNSLGKIVGELKSLTTKTYIDNVKQNNWPRFDKRLWQRDYYERIIRNEKEYLNIKKYIKNNPNKKGGHKTRPYNTFLIK